MIRRLPHRVWLLVLAGLAGSAAAADDPQLARGRALFTRQASPPCAVCHTLRDAASSGAVGPDLDDLRPDPARVVRALQQGLGNMPSFRASLPADDIAALARYLSEVAGR